MVSKSERERRLIGLYYEDIVRNFLENQFPAFDFKGNCSNGQDITALDSNGNTLFRIEVKSIREFQIEKTTKGKKIIRKGRFVIAKHQLEYDLFVFVKKFVDKEFNCTETGEYKVYFSLGKDVKQHFTHSKAKKYVKLSVDRLPDVNATKNFSNVKPDIVKKYQQLPYYSKTSIQTELSEYIDMEE